MGLTKLVLKRPVTTVLMILCLVVFGLQAFMSSPLELMPEMNMSMINPDVEGGWELVDGLQSMETLLSAG